MSELNDKLKEEMYQRLKKDIITDLNNRMFGQTIGNTETTAINHFIKVNDIFFDNFVKVLNKEIIERFKTKFDGNELLKGIVKEKIEDFLDYEMKNIVLDRAKADKNECLRKYVDNIKKYIDMQSRIMIPELEMVFQRVLKELNDESGGLHNLKKYDVLGAKK